MNARSLFVVPFMLLSFAAVALGGLAAARGAPWQGLGALLAGVAVLGFFAVLMAQRVARFHPSLPLPLGAASLGAVISAVGWSLDPSPRPGIVTLAALSAVGLAVYTFWYSRLPPRQGARLTVGAPLPAFELETGEGQRFSSDSLRGRPALLMFFRGNWCPLCMAQIREVAGMYQRLSERGVQVALVSGQSAEHTRSLARRFGLDFLYLRDPGLSVARTLGLFHEGALPLGMGAVMNADRDAYLPTVVAVDRDGVVLEVLQTDNYRVRPEPATFLALFDRYGGA